MPTGNSREPKEKVVRQSRETAINQAFSIIGKELRRKRISLAQLIRSGRKLRANLLKEEYGVAETKTQQTHLSSLQTGTRKIGT